MDQILEYIKTLDWANNWFIYIITSVLIVWFGALILKLILNKLGYVVKKLFIVSLILLVLSLLSYMMFLLGFIGFDILKVIGLGGVSESIQLFIENMSEWFKNIFSLGTVFIDFK